jgi:hypothetical protein
MSKEFEALLGQYWDLAHFEGNSGVSQGDKANEVLLALKKLAEQPAQQEPVALLPKVDVCMRAEAHGIDPSTPGLYGFYVDCISSSPQPAQQEIVAEVKAKMTGGNVGIATVIHEIYSPMRHPLVPGDLLYACPVNQAPVGWMHSRTGLFYSLDVKPDESGLLDEPTDKALPIYTSPPAQPWVDLTVTEQNELCRELGASRHQVRAIGAKLKEKNT